MALLKFGAIVTEGSGSLGGHTIQNSRGGMQLRNKPIPRSAPTAAQYAIRSINPKLQAGWKALTDAQRLIWNDYPVTHGIFNANGDHHPLSGHSLWMKYQFQYISRGAPFLDNPANMGPPYLGPEIIINGSFDSSANWLLLAGCTISGGKLNFLDTVAGVVQQVNPIPGLIHHQLSFDVSDAATFLKILFRYGSPTSNWSPPLHIYNSFPNGHYSYDVFLNLASTYFTIFISLDSSTGSLDNISLKRIY